MKFEQIYTGYIAHAAYYVECNGEAAIFDVRKSSVNTNLNTWLVLRTHL